MHNVCNQGYALIYVVSAFCCYTVLGARFATPNHFHAVAMKVETDKVTGHHYEHLYDKYLQPHKDERLRLLESEESLHARCKQGG